MMSRLLGTLHTVVAGFVRRTWLVTLATIAICAVFAAHAVAALVEPGESPASRLRPPPTSAPGLTAAQQAKSPKLTVAMTDALVERNIFCSDCVPERGSGPAGSFAEERFVPGAVLIATSVGDPKDQASSRATVHVIASDAQGSWGVGEMIGGVGVVTRIGYASIDVKNADGKIGTLKLLGETPPPKTVASPPVGAATPGAPVNEYADHVRKIDDHTYDVERQLVRDLVQGASTGKGGIRATPNFVNGELAGLKLLGVAPGSAPAAIGLHSGDVISAIDGDTIKGAQQMIDMYTKLDKLDSVELQGTRGGKPLALRLNLK